MLSKLKFGEALILSWSIIPSSPKWSPSWRIAIVTSRSFTVFCYCTTTLPLRMIYILSARCPCLNITVSAGTLIISAFLKIVQRYSSLYLAINLIFPNSASKILRWRSRPWSSLNSFLITYSFYWSILFNTLIFEAFARSRFFSISYKSFFKMFMTPSGINELFCSSRRSWSTTRSFLSELY